MCSILKFQLTHTYIHEILLIFSLLFPNRFATVHHQGQLQHLKNESDGLQTFTINSWSVLSALVVLRVSNWIKLCWLKKKARKKRKRPMIYWFLFIHNHRGNTKSYTEADGNKFIEHISCEKSFTGIKLVL